jgi:hypothetical protein
VLHPGDNPAGTISAGQGVLVALIWIVIGVINLANANRNPRALCKPARECGQHGQQPQRVFA